MRNFASNSTAVCKLALNRAEQSKNTGNLKEKAGTAKKSRMHTCLYPSRILDSNKAVCEVMRVLTDEYINPLDVLLITSGNKTAVIQANRNVLGKLLVIFTKYEKNVDFEKALTYPLTTTPLSLSNPDGTRRTTQKSKLAEVLTTFQEEKNSEATNFVEDADVYIVDFIAQIRVISKNLPETYEQLAINFLQSIPKNYNRVDIVTYRNDSIENAERNLRGTASKIAVKSEKSKIPRNSSSFMMNNENKTQLTKIIFDFIIHNNVLSLDILQTTEVLSLFFY